MPEVFEAWAVTVKGVAGYLNVGERTAYRFAQQGAFRASNQ
jgi:hypothetical protein